MTKVNAVNVALSGRNWIKTQEDINERRLNWTHTTRDRIRLLLEAIKGQSGLPDLSIQVIAGNTNGEGVNIGFKPANSGIVESAGQQTKALTKHGGRLCFSQGYNGKVFVIILYPYVEDRVGQLENKVIGHHDPREIDENFVVSAFEQFMAEMTAWESSDRTPIGYIR